MLMPYFVQAAPERACWRPPSTYSGEHEECFRTYLSGSAFCPRTPLDSKARPLPPRLLPGEISTVVNEFLHILWIESQRASAGSHLHSREIGPAPSRCVLYHPRNADAQLLRDIPRPHQLPDRPKFSGCADPCQVEVHSVYSWSQLLVRTNAWHDSCLR